MERSSSHAGIRVATGNERPISASTTLTAVIGSPIRHSLSPTIHNAAFAAAGLDWRMVALEVAPGAGAEAVSAVRVLGIAGLAVTMPHKVAVAEAVDELDVAAASLRSVNTVVLRDDATTFGASTDGDGFVDSLRCRGLQLDRARAVVLGAGAAARSVIDALGRAGVADLAIVNRTAGAAHEAAALATVGRVVESGAIGEAIAAADLLVNATSLGMGAGPGGVSASPVATELLHAGLTVAELVYHPLRTALLDAAEASGARCVDGLGMLVHQAARQQVLWTGMQPDVNVMRVAAEAALAQR